MTHPIRARRAIRRDLEWLAERIEAEADVAARYGQLERLHAIARDLREIIPALTGGAS